MTKKRPGPWWGMVIKNLDDENFGETLQPPFLSRPSLKITALSYSWTTWNGEDALGQDGCRWWQETLRQKMRLKGRVTPMRRSEATVKMSEHTPGPWGEAGIGLQHTTFTLDRAFGETEDGLKGELCNVDNWCREGGREVCLRGKGGNGQTLISFSILSRLTSHKSEQNRKRDFVSSTGQCWPSLIIASFIHN